MISAEPVTREQLIAQLEVMRGKVIDPNQGIFGPDSHFWRIGRYATAFVGAGRAALLQTAHPWVATAIKQHSRTMSDPLSRFRGTFTHVFTMVYGNLDQVVESALRVHQIHSQIEGQIEQDSGAFDKGSHYRANNIAAMVWVHATLWETSVKMYELLIGPLSEEDKAIYYQETRMFAYLFGIPDTALPADWQEFMVYNESMWNSDVLTVNDAAREIAWYLFHFNKPLQPIMNRFEVITSLIMPERLREQYRLPMDTPANRVLFDRYVRYGRNVFPYLPPHLRYLPPYMEAQRRLAGKHSPGLFVGALNRLMLGRARLVST